MKVLHLLDTLNRGGTETRVLDVCRNAERFGLELTFVACGGGKLEKEIKNSGVEFIRLQREFPVDPIIVRKLRNIIKERNIPIVQGFQPVEALHLYLATTGLKNVKCVLSHEGFIEGTKNRLTAGFLTPLMDANISVSRSLFPWLRQELSLDTSKNFYLIYNGVDEKRLRPTGHSLKAELGLAESDYLLGMIANFRPDETKDQMTVCRALPKVFEKYENAKFAFVGNVSEGGEENYEDCLRFCDENGIGDKVYFLGGRNDINDILASLDVFILSSLNEGLPISLTEAMLSKVPVIVSDIPPLLETTDNGKCAETFKTKDADELSEKIIKLLDDKALRENLSEKAYKFARQNFSIEAHFRGLITLYSDLLQDVEISAEKAIEKSNDESSIFNLD